jgi:predicted protein tyrosine phosphatase
MDDDLETAARYRLKAREARANARRIRDLEQREIMLKIADDYDNMAETLVTIYRSKVALRRPKNSK